MARRGHERGVLRGVRREEKEREKALGGREAGGGRAGEFYQPQRLLARLWRRLHGKKEGKISDGFASLELPEWTSVSVIRVIFRASTSNSYRYAAPARCRT